jgi:small redox-active disulfide protein 2
MEIKILGRGCSKCNLTEELVRAVLAEEGVEAEVEKITGVRKIAQYGVFLTPAVLINGEVKAVGRIPGKEEIRVWISKRP